MRRRSEDERRLDELQARRQAAVRQLILEERFAREIAPLSLRRRAALAAAAAERLFPVYTAFAEEEGWGDPDVLRHALDRCWEYVRGDVGSAALRGVAEAAEEAVPDFAGERRWRAKLAPEAQDAALAVVILAAAVETEDAARAVNAWQEEVNAVDQTAGLLLAKQRHAADPFEDEVIREEREIEHPLIVETIGVIERDLRDVLDTDEGDPRLVDELRTRAEASSTLERIRRFT